MTIEQYVMKVLSISKIGKLYSSDPYALENYEDLESLTLTFLNERFDESIDENLFIRDVYPTPNISVRVMIVNERDEVLFVKEADQKKWTVPGGWCDVFISPSQNAIKEVYEEVGLKISVDRLCAVFFRDIYKDKKPSVSEYVMYYKATVSSDIQWKIGFEVLDAKFCSMNSLPELTTKASKEELMMAWDVIKNDKDVYFD